MRPTNPTAASKSNRFLVWSLFGAVLLLIFWQSLVPRLVHFSNDGPLGQQNAGYVRLPQAFSSVWGDLNGLGFPGGAVAPDVSSVIRWVLGPVGYAKFLVPLTLLV